MYVDLCDTLYDDNVVSDLFHCRLTPDIVEQEESRSVSQDEESRQLPAALWEVVDTCREALLLWIRGAGIEIGSKWSVREESEEMSTTVAYLYSWRLVLELLLKSSSTVSHCVLLHI